MAIETDVLVIGAGGAGMSAALAAARAGARVVLADKSLIGRGGATVMAQMTVAAALGEEEPDDWRDHLADTLAAGRGLCDEGLAARLCEDAPVRIRELDGWGVGWARGEAGAVRQVMAPGHGRKRCCYVDFLSTGPAVAATLRTRVNRELLIRRLSNFAVTDILVADGEARGALGLDVATATPVPVAASATILATGGLTKIYARNSASANMGGDAFGLALRAGAELADMEFVQFFPIGHLAPRLVGMDPIMWDPFRYKLGGRLLNGAGEPFVERYGAADGAAYTAPRDLTTYAIWKEAAAGRGSPAGGAFLSFRHVPEAALRAAFGPVIDRLAANGIDLGRMDVEVAPIAHYHMGGVAVSERLESRVPGLFAAGEAVAGANGANRLSGNAIPEALVFGTAAGSEAAARARSRAPRLPEREAREAGEAVLAPLGARTAGPRPGEILEALRRIMWEKVGPLRDADGLAAALREIRALRAGLAEVAVPAETVFNLALVERWELRDALLAAEAVAASALARDESRGAHQREDRPHTSEAGLGRHLVTLEEGAPAPRFAALAA